MNPRTLFASLIAVALALTLGIGTASATTLNTISDPLPGSTFQGGDGNQTAEGSTNQVPNTDWESLDSSQITTNPDPGTNDSCFDGGKKQLAPGDWTFQADPACDPGVSPSKDNILAGWSTVDQPGDTFLYLAFTREAQTGNTYIAFELNQRTDRLNEAYQNGLKELAETTGGLAFFSRSTTEIPQAISQSFSTVTGLYSLTLAVPDHVSRRPQIHLNTTEDQHTLSYRTHIVLRQR